MSDATTTIDMILASKRVNEVVADELFSVTDALMDQFLLRRGFTDPNVDPERRSMLARQLLMGRLSQTSVDIVAEAAALDWPNGRELAHALEKAGISIVFARAAHEGRLDDVRDELFRFSRTVSGTPELRFAINNSEIDGSARQRLIDDLLVGKAVPQTIILARRAAVGRERTYDQTIRRYLDIAAELRGREVAKIQVACPLTPEQAGRLRTQLERIYGCAVDLEVEVNPKVVGGVRIEICDEIIDGSISTRVEEAKRRIG